MNDCIFCKIIAHEIPAKIVYEDAKLMVIEDINPKAKVHLLVLTKKHIKSLQELKIEDKNLMGDLILKIPEIAQKAGLEEGFRTVVNTGKKGGQIVHHIHFHILGGDLLPKLSQL